MSLIPLIASYSLGPDEPAFEQMRAGFSDFIDIEFIRDRMTGAEFQRILCGEETLDVETLKSMAYKAHRVTDRCFNWLFDWLENADVETKHKFMQFVTGSPSFRLQRIEIEAGTDDQRYPLGHSCFHRIDLPRFNSLEELGDGMRVALSNNLMLIE